MHDLHTKEADLTERQTDSTLRRGGLAGILGSLLMLATTSARGATRRGKRSR